MKKISLLLFSCMVTLVASSQLVVILQSPPAGFTYKPQLWTMVLTNTTNAAMNLHIEVTLNVTGSSQQVLAGVTGVFTLPSGTKQINANQLMPIQYNVVAPSYNVDPNPLGLLPLGEFEVCYHFFKHSSDQIEQIAEECQEITIGPLSPPQLVYPYDQASLEETHPQFTWLPPVPANLFSNLQYDLTLVEVNLNQSAADAMQQNIPLYQSTNLANNSLLYPFSATGLQYDHQYAWRVVAKSNGAVVGTSEVWEFTLKQSGSVATRSTPALPFVQLKKNPETAYAIFVGEIKFSYFNETSDTSWKVKVTDLSDPSREEYFLDLDTLRMNSGHNLVRYNVYENSFFFEKHIYQLELFNSRNEIWRLRFEYRATNDLNN